MATPVPRRCPLPRTSAQRSLCGCTFRHHFQYAVSGNRGGQNRGSIATLGRFDVPTASPAVTSAVITGSPGIPIRRPDVFDRCAVPRNAVLPPRT
jgi:hypothetical protein